MGGQYRNMRSAPTLRDDVQMIIKVLFSGLPTAPPVCVDKIPNCKLYDPDTCTNPMYNLWVDDNCKQFCGRCKCSKFYMYVSQLVYKMKKKMSQNASAPT